MPQIKIKLFDDGTTDIDGVGFQGTACDGPINAVADALLAKKLADNKKPEYDLVQGENLEHEGGL